MGEGSRTLNKFRNMMPPKRLSGHIIDYSPPGICQDCVKAHIYDVRLILTTSCDKPEFMT